MLLIHDAAANAVAVLTNSADSADVHYFDSCTEAATYATENSGTDWELTINRGEVPDNGFRDLANLVKLTLEDGVTSIGNYAFRLCTGLTGSLVIPDGVTSIGNNAFSGCSGLTGSLVIPDGVTSIGNNAFYGCSGFTTLTLPSTLTSIGNYAFSGCTGLTGSLVIPDGVTSIGNNAFNGCTGLTGSLVIPDGVTSIGNYAFYGCSGFTTLTLPSTLTSIGASAFRNCPGFTGGLVIPGSVTSIGDYAFYLCSGFDDDLSYGGTSDPGGSATGVFSDTNFTKCKVTESYEDEEFCGLPVVNEDAAVTDEEVAAITAFFAHAGCLVSSGGMVGMLTEAAAEELREQQEAFLAQPTAVGLFALWQAVAARLTAPEGAYWELADPDTGATLGSDNYVKAADGTISGTLTETTGGTGAPGVWAAAWDGTVLRLTNLNTGLLLDEEDGAATLSAEGAALAIGADGCVEVGGDRREVRTVETISKTINSYGIATAHYPFAVRLADGLTALRAINETSEISLPELGTSELPAYTPVVLAGAAGTYALTLLPEGAEALADVENDLTGVCCMETIADDVTAYVMSVVDSEVGFYILSSVNRTLSANICYIIDS